jgi:hypothetical protein
MRQLFPIPSPFELSSQNLQTSHSKISNVFLLLIPLLVNHEIFSLVSLCSTGTINTCSIKSECINSVTTTLASYSQHAKVHDRTTHLSALTLGISNKNSPSPACCLKLSNAVASVDHFSFSILLRLRLRS